MARRKYKKTKRKLSRKVIHKTRRRTKNRVKKISKNQSGGVINSVPLMLEVNKEIPSASATKKRGRAKQLLSDEELGQLVINSLFKKTIDVSFIQDSSRYAFILYGTVSGGVLFDTKNLPLREALDIDNIDKGIPLQHFCMKLSLVLDVPRADTVENYCYTDIENQTHSKRAVSVIRSTKEAHLQKKLYDSFSCISGRSVFVPDVIAHGVFNREKLEEYINLFRSNILAAATKREIELETTAGIDDNVLHVFEQIIERLQQKNIEDGRIVDAEKQNWALDILLMEYIDTKYYKTLNVLGTKTGFFVREPTFDVFNIQEALLITAAQLACATGVRIILYDCHPNNALSNESQNDVRLIDIGSAIDLNNKCDKQFILQTFDTMLTSIRSGENKFCTIEQLYNFFDVIIAHTTVKKQTKESKRPKQTPYEEILTTQKFQENLDRLVDFRCGQFILENIHYNLIMTAFVDFMMFIVVYGRDICQSRYTMESVYGAYTFSNFSAFLTQFRPNDKTFRISRTHPDSYDANLVKVGTEISKIVTLCPSVKCPIDSSHLRLSHMLEQLPGAPPPSLPGAPPPSLPPAPLPPTQAQSPPIVPQPPSRKGCLIM